MKWQAISCPVEYSCKLNIIIISTKRNFQMKTQYWRYNAYLLQLFRNSLWPHDLRLFCVWIYSTTQTGTQSPAPTARVGTARSRVLPWPVPDRRVNRALSLRPCPGSAAHNALHQEVSKQIIVMSNVKYHLEGARNICQ